MLLITIDEMLSSKYSDMIPLKCDGCQQDFQRIQKQLKSDYKLKSQLKHFCSNKCQTSLIKKERLYQFNLSSLQGSFFIDS